MQQQALDLTTPPVAQARAVGQAAADLAEMRAERIEPGFCERAEKHILFTLGHLIEASGEALTDLCKRDGITPPDMRAFGAVFARLAKAGKIVCVRADLPRARGHGTSGGRLWRLA